MQITIKVLKDSKNQKIKDCTLEVDATSSILSVKQQIETALQIPPANQKLLLLGRPLNNEQTVSSYNIKDGSKINLVVMKPSLRDCIHRAFRKYYTEQQSERLTNEFMTDFDMRLKELSLDDLERLAENVHSRLPA